MLHAGDGTMIQQSGQKPAREAVEDKIKMDDKQRE
jgi:hypothetical protein